ncbi:DUF1003 domain-containing protein [Arthrobacter sp.]|uniref:DUF1003 domain-containing protein n=1 Tax=Arthrobacter sp. TaxID=1667 RepID=UPI003396C785
MSVEKKNWHASHKRSLTRGERAADVLRNGMGSWRFVAGFIAFMIIWALVNSWIRDPWDAYPFILLNLFLSMLAGLQGAILLIAAKRQDAIAAAMAEHDFATDTEAKNGIEQLLAINREQLELIRRLQEQLAGRSEQR